ncbi:hypothetical protein A2U01_0046545, partial [Trifolium medium]|nr:hypothetical protein [Trifolium medium]
RQRKKGGKASTEPCNNDNRGSGERISPASVEEVCTVVPETLDGLNLEVVLPGGDPTPTSGIALLLDVGTEEEFQQPAQLVSDAS